MLIYTQTGHEAGLGGGSDVVGFRHRVSIQLVTILEVYARTVGALVRPMVRARLSSVEQQEAGSA